MKQALTDLKSFITVSMIILLFVIVIANIFGHTLEANLFTVITNLTTLVFTHYLTKKTDNTEESSVENVENSAEDTADTAENTTETEVK